MIIKKDGFLTSTVGEKKPALEQLAMLLCTSPKLDSIRRFLGNSITLVPVPGSSACDLKDSLWCPKRFCEEIVTTTLCKDMAVVIQRHISVQKSAYAGPGERPTVQQHLDSLAVVKSTIFTDSIVVVDDVITKGATLWACIAKLKEAYSDKRIIGLAAVRTLREPTIETESMLQPFMGKIERKGDTTQWLV